MLYFVVLLLVAALVYYVLSLFLPHPIPAIVAAIIVILAVVNLVGEVHAAPV
jgi:hypothetical protein